MLTTDIFLITGIYDDDPEIITLSYSDFGGCVNNTTLFYLFILYCRLPPTKLLEKSSMVFPIICAKIECISKWICSSCLPILFWMIHLCFWSTKTTLNSGEDQDKFVQFWWHFSMHYAYLKCRWTCLKSFIRGFFY